jgi:hypothetical protein
MPESIYDRINRTLTWKRVATFNVGLFLILIIPLSVNLAQQNTENRSGAAGEVEVPVVTPPPNYPVEPPRLDRVSMFFGKKGDTVVLLGNNFGDYQWSSRLFVGNVEVESEHIVRWSNSVIEVKIPETARSGRVWISVNNQEQAWNGTLLLYDSSSNTRVNLKRLSSNQAVFGVVGGGNGKSGLLELGYVAEPIQVTPAANVEIIEQTTTADALGKKMTLKFNLTAMSGSNNLMTIDHPGIGAVELVRVELYDAAGGLIPLYADPLEMKVFP